MAAKAPLNALIDLARERTEQATRRLGQLQGARQNAAQQLNMLQDYRQDYLERLQQAMQAGMPAADCYNYQRFIATLDEAISQQSLALGRADQQLDSGRAQWRDEKRRLDSFDALQTRHARQQARLDARKEQRANDEHAARLARYPAGIH
ncbi:flagellar export protein FliJ [Orrella sp. JC864]|uniref:flagellar export protein FliJ n=1 Tax=Orrella sp. JC864 TaxID=3120298 RepID=UPI0012BBC442